MGLGHRYVKNREQLIICVLFTAMNHSSTHIMLYPIPIFSKSQKHKRKVETVQKYKKINSLWVYLDKQQD